MANQPNFRCLPHFRVARSLLFCIESQFGWLCFHCRASFIFQVAFKLFFPLPQHKRLVFFARAVGAGEFGGIGHGFMAQGGDEAAVFA